MQEKLINQTGAEEKPRTTQPDEQIWGGGLPEKQLACSSDFAEKLGIQRAHEDSPQCSLTPDCSSPRSYKKTIP